MLDVQDTGSRLDDSYYALLVTAEQATASLIGTGAGLATAAVTEDAALRREWADRWLAARETDIAAWRAVSEWEPASERELHRPVGVTEGFEARA